MLIKHYSTYNYEDKGITHGGRVHMEPVAKALVEVC